MTETGKASPDQGYRFVLCGRENNHDEAELICCYRWRGVDMRRGAALVSLLASKGAIGFC